MSAKDKSSLLDFIQYKFKGMKYLDTVLPMLKNMSYTELKEWAIAHDIIG
jgi:hypothetical protein